MNKSKPFALLSVRFGISRESAKYFLTRVQKSFKREKPPHQLILKFMEEKNFDSLPEPYDVASLMNKAGIWPYPMQSKPPSPFSSGEENLYAE